jgi:hypothetical protein
MQCYYLVSVDERGELTGCISLPTPGGEVIVLFLGENEKMNVIARFFVDRLPVGHGVRSAYVEVSSPKEAAREIKQTFLNLDAAVFLMDSDPFVTQVVAALRQRGR